MQGIINTYIKPIFFILYLYSESIYNKYSFIILRLRTFYIKYNAEENNLKRLHQP